MTIETIGLTSLEGSAPHNVHSASGDEPTPLKFEVQDD